MQIRSPIKLLSGCCIHALVSLLQVHVQHFNAITFFSIGLMLLAGKL